MPPYLKGMRGIFPNMECLPTRGVTLDNIKGWFEAGALAVGIGSALTSTYLESQDRSDVVARATELARAGQSIGKTSYM